MFQRIQLWKVMCVIFISDTRDTGRTIPAMFFKKRGIDASARETTVYFGRTWMENFLQIEQRRENSIP